jgi:predicted transcriptional regulator
MEVHGLLGIEEKRMKHATSVVLASDTTTVLKNMMDSGLVYKTREGKYAFTEKGKSTQDQTIGK